MQRGIGLGLHDVDQSLAHQLQDGNEGDRDAHAAFMRAEQLHERHETAAAERREDIAHALAEDTSAAPPEELRAIGPGAAEEPPEDDDPLSAEGGGSAELVAVPRAQEG